MMLEPTAFEPDYQQGLDLIKIQLNNPHDDANDVYM